MPVLYFFIFSALISCSDTPASSPVFVTSPHGTVCSVDTSFFMRLADSAVSLTKSKVIYDPSYVNIPYPNGDVAADRGVCSDVIIRAYRKLGIDLQQLVHVDMTKHFTEYPRKWQRSSADHNIDHRRVPNLMKFFERSNASRPVTSKAIDYRPGDIVCWNLYKAVTHIGLVVNVKSGDGERFLIVHNIGSGQVLADCLFSYKIIGHYRYRK